MRYLYTIQHGHEKHGDDISIFASRYAKRKRFDGNLKGFHICYILINEGRFVSFFFLSLIERHKGNTKIIFM